MGKKKNSIYLLLAVIFFSASCASQYDKLLKSTDYELKYLKAKEYYDLKKYARSATLLDQVMLYFRGTPKEDSVLILLAKSYFYDGDIYSAAEYFNQFRQTFPRSPFAEEASMLRLVCLYEQTWRYELDQRPSYATLAAIQEFRYTYPHSEFLEKTKKMEADLNQRLEQKEFEAAKLYYTMEDYRAATTALKTALKNRPETMYREEILYLLVASTYQYAEHSIFTRQKDRFQAMIDEYYNFVSEFPDSKHRPAVNKMYATGMEKLK